MTTDLEGLRLSDHADRTFTFGEIAEEVGGNADALRAWFNGGGLALAPPFDTVADKGGRGVGHRLHWRTLVLLLLAIKLNGFGFGLRSGEAAQAAGAAMAAGLDLGHLCSEDSPLIAVEREAEGMIRVSLVARGAPAGAVEDPSIRDGFDGVGTLILDPIGFGRVVWRLAIRQAHREGEAADPVQPEAAS